MNELRSESRQNLDPEAWIAALRDRDGATRKRARHRLVDLGPRATPSLVGLLDDDDRRTRWEAAMALKDIADPASVPALLGALVDDDGDVGWVAAEALAAMGRPAVVALLRALVESDDSARLRQGAHHVLREVRRTGLGHRVAGVYEALGGMNADVDVPVEARRALEALEA